MKENKINNVYVEYGWDPEIEEKFLSTILVEKSSGHSYFSVPNYYLKLSPDKKLKIQNKLLKNFIKLKKQVGKDKIFVDTEEGHRQIEKYKESYINVQDFFDLSQTVFPFIFSAPMGIFSYLLFVNSLIHGISTIHRNLDLPKLKTLNRVKLILSAFFLSLNVSFGIKNLAVNMDVAKEQVFLFNETYYLVE